MEATGVGRRPLARSHRPAQLHATLSAAQEAAVVELRKTLLLPLDDLLAVVHAFIHPQLSRSALDRCLRRHGVSNLAQLIATTQDTQPPPEKKTFKDYAPGFVHLDVKYLPQMPDETRQRYLFVAIDRATRWVYLELLASKSARAAAGFLHRASQAAPFRITKLLTDNGKEFTATGERQPTGRHAFDQTCQQQGIEHRLIRPPHPQTNGRVERFNGRISEILTTTHFDSAADLKTTLTRYARIYNHHIPQRALGHRTPIQALKDWQQQQPDLFTKRVCNQAGLDV